ncbi:MAG: MOSC domain-containing protein [Candidatus Nitrosocosmicus sp.]|nr:MOSC domain-containing protein [Candidatus Nitrosocosmicus sp.]MDN5866544.1 MOSC domain-containing protein [Candidatus Nitrosocosmicus sp.]
MISVNVGLPRQISYENRQVVTSIFKEPVEGRVKVTTLNLNGDAQADLSVHGGVDKAVYSYSEEHYKYWKEAYPTIDMSFGMFGENLTTQGLNEDMVNIGDQYRIGTSRLVVTQSQMPCYKLGIKFGRMDILKKFVNSQRPGIYYKVLEEGELGAGDNIKLLYRDKNNVTINDIVRLYINDHNDGENISKMQKAIKLEFLPEPWRIYFGQKIVRLQKS